LITYNGERSSIETPPQTDGATNVEAMNVEAMNVEIWHGAVLDSAPIALKKALPNKSAAVPTDVDNRVEKTSAEHWNGATASAGLTPRALDTLLLPPAF